jgi:hypothetical protein
MPQLLPPALPSDVPTEIGHWRDRGLPGVDELDRDPGAAQQWLARCVGDDAAMARLRSTAQALADGVDLSRADEHAVTEQLAHALAEGRLRAGSGAAAKLRRLVVAPAPAAPAPPAAASPRAARVAPPSVAETTFNPNLDVAAMVAVLEQAARDGTPLCEECQKEDEEAAPVGASR